VSHQCSIKKRGTRVATHIHIYYEQWEYKFRLKRGSIGQISANAQSNEVWEKRSEKRRAMACTGYTSEYRKENIVPKDNDDGQSPPSLGRPLPAQSDGSANHSKDKRSKGQRHLFPELNFGTPDSGRIARSTRLECSNLKAQISKRQGIGIALEEFNLGGSLKEIVCCRIS